MLKLVIFLTFAFALSNAQLDPYEVCVGLPDDTLIGVGADISCTEYFACFEEIGYIEDCLTRGDDLEFNYETNDCDFNDIVNCAANYPDPEPETDAPPPPPPAVTTTTSSTTVDLSSDIECPTNRPGEILFFPSSNCSEYFICANGVRMRMVCMEGFTWNQEEKTCDFPIFSRCSVSFKKIIVLKIYLISFLFFCSQTLLMTVWMFDARGKDFTQLHIREIVQNMFSAAWEFRWWVPI